MSKIARRKFLQLSAVAAAGCFVQPGREAHADDLPQLSLDDPMATAMKYTHDASTVDPATRNNPAADQTCANCALVQGEGDWRPSDLPRQICFCQGLVFGLGAQSLIESHITVLKSPANEPAFSFRPVSFVQWDFI